MRCSRCGRDDCAALHDTCPSQFIVGAEVYWVGGGMDVAPTLGLFLGLDEDGMSRFKSDTFSILVGKNLLAPREKWPVLVMA